MLYQDRIYGKINISEPVVLELINSQSLQRLKNIDQAGYHEPHFPGTSHSRFEHSLGVYLLLKRYKAPRNLDIALTIVYTLDMKTVINIKTDKEVKKNAQRLASDLGFSLSAIINAYLKQFIRNKEVYFGVIPHMSSSLEKLLGEIEKDINNKRNTSRAFSSKKEINKYLSSL